MQRWFRSIRQRLISVQSTRGYITSSEHICVPTASAGSITVSLRNVLQKPPSTPLLVYLPAFSEGPEESVASLPSFADDCPTAIINYRWPDTPEGEGLKNSLGKSDSSPQPSPHLWPTPIHDTLFGYEWIVKNLAPPERRRRDIYVFGSYLGASLGAALALTESHPHHRMGVRGFVAYNGIYNWATFLPDHPINNVPDLRFSDLTATEDQSSAYVYLKRQIPTLFRSPSDLFDPFASPTLLFHTAGVDVPQEFAYSNISPSLLKAIDALSLGSENLFRPPRKGYLKFPPKDSTLKIPESLLLHESPPPTPFRRRGTGKGAGKSKPGRHGFAMQANELATMMRRSVNKVELKDRLRWDEEFEGYDTEAERRIQVADVGKVGTGFALNEAAQEMIDTWLRSRMGR